MCINVVDAIQWFIRQSGPIIIVDISYSGVEEIEAFDTNSGASVDPDAGFAIALRRGPRHATRGLQSALLRLGRSLRHS